MEPRTTQGALGNDGLDHWFSNFLILGTFYILQITEDPQKAFVHDSYIYHYFPYIKQNFKKMY